jgi:putative tryptophan/tyrosine transport system substrate-binding protein
LNFFQAELGGKALGLLRELLPTAARIGLLVNPSNPNIQGVMNDVTAAAAVLGVQIDVVQARDSREIEASFATLVRNRVDALLVGADSLFFHRRLQLATLATRHAIAAVYTAREFAEAGGLMSYGTNLTEMYRQSAIIRAASSRAPSPPICQSCSRPSSSSSSTSRLPERSASKCRRRCSPAPTR